MLRELREQRGLLLREAAAALQMDQAILSKIERGQRLPTEQQTQDLELFFALPSQKLQALRLKELTLREYGDKPAWPAALVLIQEEKSEYRVNNRSTAADKSPEAVNKRRKKG